MPTCVRSTAVVLHHRHHGYSSHGCWLHDVGHGHGHEGGGARDRRDSHLRLIAAIRICDGSREIASGQSKGRSHHGGVCGDKAVQEQVRRSPHTSA